MSVEGAFKFTGSQTEAVELSPISFTRHSSEAGETTPGPSNYTHAETSSIPDVEIVQPQHHLHDSQQHLHRHDQHLPQGHTEYTHDTAEHRIKPIAVFTANTTTTNMSLRNQINGASGDNINSDDNSRNGVISLNITDTQMSSSVTLDDIDALQPEGLSALLNENQYTMRKMAAQALMDVALMMANISQLRTLLTAESDLDYHTPLLVLVSLSLVAQVLFAIIIFIVWMRESEDNYRAEFMKTIKQVAASKEVGARAAAATVNLQADRAKQEEKFLRHQTTNRLNYCTIVLVFLITVINMFITGFGIKLTDVSNTTINSVPG